jgi:hypothetical protein
MTKDAWEVFKECAEDLSKEAHAPGFPRQMRGACSKLEAYLARLSLILALSRVVESNAREQIEPRDMLAASALVDYFKAHARRAYVGLYDCKPDDLLSADLAWFLQQHVEQ